MRDADSELRRLFQIRVAEGAIGPSAMRNQGSKRVVRNARRYLSHIDLSRIAVRRESAFRAILDRHTERLRRSLPPKAKHWGTARKALNLFLRDILYHLYLSKDFRFERVEAWLEVPLDRYVADGIRRSYRGPLPRWRGIIHLRPQESAAFQHAAQRIARATGVAPVHLDVFWWRNVAGRREDDA
jgi:hypothetical protein